MMKRWVAVAAVAAAVSGCAGTGGNRSIPEADFDFDPKAMHDLAQASIEARDEQRLLAKTRDAVAMRSMTPEQKEQRFLQATTVPEGFGEESTVQFDGPLYDAVTVLSALAGYNEVEEVGSRPRSPIMISVDQRNTPLINALNELGMQSGDRATVEVYPSRKTMRIVYNDIDQQG